MRILHRFVSSQKKAVPDKTSNVSPPEENAPTSGSEYKGHSAVPEDNARDIVAGNNPTNVVADDAKEGAVSADASKTTLARLHHVRSIEECMALFEGDPDFGQGAPSEQIISVVYAECMTMRAKGMGMEPNIVGRTLPIFICDKRLAGSASTRFAAVDSDVHSIFAEGNENAQENNPSRTQYRYQHILELFPKHGDFLVQYAHALKDQKKYRQSLLSYFDALIYGAPLYNVEEHALFAAERVELKKDVARRLTDTRSMCSSNEVRTLSMLLLGTQGDDKTTIALMLKSYSISSTIIEIMNNPSFCKENGDFLRFVVESNWSAENA